MNYGLVLFLLMLFIFLFFRKFIFSLPEKFINFLEASMDALDNLFLKGFFRWIFLLLVIVFTVLIVFFPIEYISLLLNYGVEIIIAIAAIDGVIISIWLPLYWDRRNKIKEIFSNEQIVDYILKADVLLKSYPTMIVFHLILSICSIFFFKVDYLIIPLLMINVFLFSYFILLLQKVQDRLEYYSCFSRLDNNENSIINKLVTKYKDDKYIFYELIEFIRIIITSVTKANSNNKIIDRYLKLYGEIYIEIQREITTAKVGNIFIEEMSNGLFRRHHDVILSKMVMIFTEPTILFRNKIYIQVAIPYTYAEILKNSYNKNLEYNNFPYFGEINNLGTFSKILSYLIEVSKQNISLFDAHNLFNEEHLVLNSTIDWFFLLPEKFILSRKPSDNISNYYKFNDFEKTIIQEMMDLFFYATETKNANRYFGYLIDYIKDINHNLKENKFHILQIVASILISQCIHKKKYDIISILFKDCKIDGRTYINAGLQIIPNYIGCIYATFVLSLDKKLLIQYSWMDNIKKDDCLLQTFVFLLMVYLCNNKNNNSCLLPEAKLLETVAKCVKDTPTDKIFDNILINNKNIIDDSIEKVFKNTDLIRSVTNFNAEISQDVKEQVKKFVCYIIETMETRKKTELESPLDVTKEIQKIKEHCYAYFNFFQYDQYVPNSYFAKDNKKNIEIKFKKEYFLLQKQDSYDNILGQFEIALSRILYDVTNQLSIEVTIEESKFRECKKEKKYFIIVGRNYPGNSSNEILIATGLNKKFYKDFRTIKIDYKCENILLLKDIDYIDIELKEDISKGIVMIVLHAITKSQFVKNEDYFVIRPPMAGKIELIGPQIL